MRRRDRKRGAELLAKGLLELHPDEAAQQIEKGPVDAAARLMEGVDAARAADVIERLTPGVAVDLLSAMNDEQLRTVLAALEPQRAAPLLARLDETMRVRWLGLLDPALATELRELCTFPPDTAGALMDPRVLAVPPETTAREALSRLRGFRDRKIRRLFLVNASGKLIGSVELQEIAIASPTERLDQLSVSGPLSVQVTAGLEEVMEVSEANRAGTLPVVDFDGRLVGVIRHDALIGAARDDATTDMQTMVGASRDERALSPIPFAVRKRLPWLEVNLGTAFLAAAVVGFFEETISRNTALAVLLPVVAGQSGNTGSQALAVTMRGLALREIRLRQWIKLCFKELNVALLNGVAVALTTAFFVFLWSRSTGLSLVIGLSMIISMAAAGLSGAAIPMLLTAFKQDPAQSSSIILTTVTDVVGFFSFLGIATLLSAML